jgi:MFS family permease
MDEQPPPSELLPPTAPPELREPGFLSRIRRHAIDLTPLRISKDLRRLVTGQAISEFGTQITGVAIPVQVYEITRSPLAVGLLSLFEAVPLLVLPIVGGAIADAVERRKLLIWAHIGMATLSIVLAANAALPTPHLWVLYAVSFLWVSGYSLYSPAIRAWPARLVGPDLIPSVMALDVTYYSSAAIAGPAIAGVLIATAGYPSAYVLDAISYAAVVVAVFLMAPSPPAHEGAEVGWASIKEGFRFLRGKPVLQGSFWIDLNAMIFGLPEALFPAFVLDRLGAGTALVGVFYAAPAVGSLLGALVSGRAKHVRRQGIACSIAVVAWGLAIVGFGLSRTAWLAIGFLALAGASDFVSGIYRTAILVRATPDEMRGRLEGISLTVVATGPSLGNLEAGALATVTTVPFSIVSGGVLCVLGVGVLALVLPAFRRYVAPIGDDT